MSNKIRVGIIGVGGIAGLHIGGLKKIKDVDIIALADISEDAMKKRVREQELSSVRSFTDYREMLKLKELDAVSICTPNALHKQPTLDALKAGKHVMVEKPLAMNAREGQAMVDAARKAHRILSTGFQYRFYPGAQFLRQAVRENVMGRIVYGRAQYLRRRGIPSWGVFGRKELQGGGPLIDLGVHVLEVAHYIMGKPRPVTASAGCYTYIGNRKPEATPVSFGDWDWKTYTVEDLTCGFIRFEDGQTLALETSFAAHIEQDVLGVTFMGTKGGAWFDGNARLFTDTLGKMVNMDPKLPPFAFDQAIHAKLHRWINAIQGDENDSSGEDGLAIQKIIDGLYRSAKTGREVTL